MRDNPAEDVCFTRNGAALADDPARFVAAIKHLDSGRVFTGHTHAHAYRCLETWIQSERLLPSREIVDGFIHVASQAFLSREDAATLLNRTGRLRSEDLIDTPC